MKKYIAPVTLVILSIACGQATLPQEPIYTPQAKASIQQPVLTPTAQPTEAALTVTALGKVNVRTCPATSCDLVEPNAYIEAGQVIEVGKEIKNDVIDCPRWYPVVYNGRGAFVCSEWFTK